VRQSERPVHYMHYVSAALYGLHTRARMRACAALLRDGLASEKLPFRGKAQKPGLLCFTTNELLKESVSSVAHARAHPAGYFSDCRADGGGHARLDIRDLIRKDVRSR